MIASEGADTERIYFEGLKNDSENPKNNQFIKIEFLERISEEARSESSHKAVMEQLNQYKVKYQLEEADELWLLIDRDKSNNPVQKVANIAQSCKQKGYFLALSNPCFELWLLLHIRDLEAYSAEEQKAIFENKRISQSNSSKKKLDKELSNLLGGYSKSKYNFEDFKPHIPDAIERAKNLDTSPEQRWIEEKLNTRVYLLVEKIISQNIE